MSQRDEEFRRWAVEHRPALLRTAVLLAAGDSHTAEDVVQTTLTRLYLAWPRVRRAEQREAYARRALVNAFTDEVRRSWRGHEDSRADVPDQLVQDPTGIGDRNRVLYDALGALPARMRAAVVLRYLHGLSTDETARALRCTEGTVKSQTARALTKLESRLGPILHPTATSAEALPNPNSNEAPHRGSGVVHCLGGLS